MAPIPNDSLTTNFATTITGAAAIIFWVIFLIIILYSLRGLYGYCLRRGYMGRGDQPLPQHLNIAIDPPRTGLDPSVIALLPTFVYKKSDDQIDGTGTGGTTDECSICLSTIEEEEMVRLLPKCSHMFHSQCIDMWLSSHSTCPICRASVVAEPPPPVLVAEQEESSSEAQTMNHGTTSSEGTASALNSSALTPTSSEGTATDDTTAQSSKVGAPSTFHKILSLRRSGRRIQPFELSADGVEDLERQ